MNIYLSLVAVITLCLVVVTLPHWPIFRRQAHPPILSISAGIGIAYVFLALLPKLAEVQASLQVSADKSAILPVELHAYLGALAGFVIFLLIANRGFSDNPNGTLRRLSLSDLVVLAVFGLYYAQVAFLLGEWPSDSWVGYGGLIAVVGMHFVGINFHIWKRYPHRFPKVFCWVLCGFLIFGWLGAVIAKQLSGVVKLSTMIVAGGIIITAIREEIPSSRDANIPFFSFRYLLPPYTYCSLKSYCCVSGYPTPTTRQSWSDPRADRIRRFAFHFRQLAKSKRPVTLR